MPQVSWKTAKGWINDYERPALYQHAQRLGPGALIVNVGIEYGASMHCLSQGAPQAEVVGIDIDLSRLEGAEARWHLIQADSGYVAQGWERPIDLIFIDGDHSTYGIGRDVVWADKVKPGGVIGFHDCLEVQFYTHWVEVNEAVNAWLATQPAGRWIEEPSAGTIRFFRRGDV